MDKHTPRTDALCSKLFHDDGPHHKRAACSESDAFQIAELARQIERNNDELVAALEEILAFDSMDYSLHIKGMQEIARAALSKAKG